MNGATHNEAASQGKVVASKVTLRFYVSGVVQGVGYRRWFCAVASELGLEGWVRNRRDGRVEALCMGDLGAINKMQALAHQGPLLASVERVAVEPAEYDAVKKGFYTEETL